MTSVRLDNLSFTAENVVVAIQSDEESVCAVCDILDHAMGQMQELAIIGNGGVEVPSHFQETTGEDEVSQAAIGEDKGIPTVREGMVEMTDFVCNVLSYLCVGLV
jgi:hypothetical protein